MIERAKPVSEQVYEILLERLDKGQYAPKERMPSETRLASEFDVSRATVRIALARLEAQGLIIRRQGDGTYANPAALGIHLKPHQEWQIIQQIQASGRNPAIDLLAAERLPASQIDLGELFDERSPELWQFRYRFLADNEPVMVALYTLPADLLEPFDPQEDLVQPLIKFLDEFSKQKLAYGQATFNGVAAHDLIAAELQVAPGSSVLEVRSRLFNQNDHLIALTREYYRQGEGLKIQLYDQ